MSFSINSEKISGTLGWAVLICSAIIAGDLAAASTEKRMMPEPEPYEAVEVSKAQRDAVPNHDADLSLVLRQPPEEVQKEEVKKEEEKKKPKEEVKKAVSFDGVSLRGTVISGSYRAALLETPDGPVLLPLGESFADYKLDEVASSWATFDKDDETVQLVLDTMKDPDADSVTVTSKAAPEADEPVVPDEEEEKQEPEEEPKLSLADVRAVLDNPAKISAGMRVVPQERDGQPYGTRVDFRDPNNLMAKMGIKNGDILLSVNGAPTRTPDDMYQGYMTIRNAEALEFVVDRGGETQTIRYEFVK